MNYELVTQTIDLGDGRPVTIETGKLAKQANGSVVVRQGDTMLLAAVVLKLVPAMVTVAPGTVVPEAGLMLVMTGPEGLLRNTETLLPVKFPTARSGLPSPSKSPIETERGTSPVVKSTLAAKLLAEMLPLMDVLRKTETLALKLLVTARSGLPSPSRSPISTEKGRFPVA